MGYLFEFGKLFCFLLSVVITCAFIDPNDGSKLRRNGCIVTLARGYEDVKQYNDTILRRNKSVRDHLYSIESCATGNCSAVADMIIFHEGNINKTQQDYIQSGTPDMPIKFVNISAVFQHYHHVSNPICPPSSVSQSFGPGYFSMCYFWFLKFQEYVSQYDWMLRIDADCILQVDSRRNIYYLKKNVHFAAAKWLNLEGEEADNISERDGGSVVIGMRNLTQNFAFDHGIYDYIRTWRGPYTNVMYINLEWLRRAQIISKYMSVVEESGCIYGNRWGDLPLWGAAIHIAKEPTRRLNLSYFHGSHDTLVT